MKFTPDERRFFAQSPGPRRRRPIPFREKYRNSIGTLSLGVLSISLGLFALSVSLSSTNGAKLPPWNEPYDVMIEGSQSISVMYEDDSETRLTEAVIVKPGTTIQVLSTDTDILCATGVTLGLIGLYLGWRSGRFAFLCAAGLLLCVLAPLSSFLHMLSVEASF